MLIDRHLFFYVLSTLPFFFAYSYHLISGFPRRTRRAQPEVLIYLEILVKVLRATTLRDNTLVAT